MTKTGAPTVLAKRNGELRTLLRAVLELGPETVNPQLLGELQDRIRRTLSAHDGRTTGAGFTQPGVLDAARQTRAAKTAAFYAAHGETLRGLAAEGLSTRAIAARLNDAGIPSPGGGTWAPGSVKHAVDRLPPRSE